MTSPFAVVMRLLTAQQATAARQLIRTRLRSLAVSAPRYAEEASGPLIRSRLTFLSLPINLSG